MNIIAESLYNIMSMIMKKCSRESIIKKNANLMCFYSSSQFLFLIYHDLTYLNLNIFKVSLTLKIK